MKSANCTSQIGCIPYNAAPMPTPTMESSASGESITRSAPYFSNRPMVARKTPPRGPTSSPTMNTRSSRPSSSSMAWRRPSISVMSAMPDILRVHREATLLQAGIGCLGRQADRLFHLLLGPGLDLLLGLVVQCSEPHQPVAEAGHRILRLHRFHFLARTVATVIVVRGVRGHAVHHGLHHRRAVAGACPRHRLRHPRVHPPRVQSIP